MKTISALLIATLALSALSADQADAAIPRGNFSPAQIAAMKQRLASSREHVQFKAVQHNQKMDAEAPEAKKEERMRTPFKATKAIKEASKAKSAVKKTAPKAGMSVKKASTQIDTVKKVSVNTSPAAKKSLEKMAAAPRNRKSHDDHDGALDEQEETEADGSEGKQEEAEAEGSGGKQEEAEAEGSLGKPEETEADGSEGKQEETEAEGSLGKPEADLVVSLIPYTFHATVIKSAIRTKKNVVTTSYVSPAMEELNEECKKAGITVMNEIGLDPGIDHLYAVKTISEVHAAGGKITSFISFCGGLPAPEASNNPLGYKFSWSSRGVLLALRNAAKIYQDGKVVSIDGPDLMATAKPYFIYPGFAFVGYPNRDSTPFRERYEIPEAQTVIRGTLRYQGFPEMIKVLVDIGFLKDDANPVFDSAVPWKEATAKVLGAASSSEQDLITAVQSKTSFPNNEERDRLLAGLRWIGLFSDETITPRGNALDTLCATLEKKMQYGPDERDMVMLQHRFEIEHKDGSKETRTSTLCEYGNPAGYSAMAKLVGVPCGVAVKQVLDGTISQKGVLAPMTMEICAPLLKTLKEEYGIEMEERTL